MTTEISTPAKEKEEKKPTLMDNLFKTATFNVPKVDDLVEGTIVGQRGMVVYVDVAPLGTGLIYGREFMNVQDTMKVLKIGDKITVKITELKNEQDYLSLSLKDANQEIIWREVEKYQKDKAPLEIKVTDANKGGLIIDFKGIPGFLPTSQLKPEHYPRIEDGDQAKILEKLKELVGNTLIATIITVDSKEDKLIFSEKGIQTEEAKEMISKYNVGDIIDGEVTGIVDFGVFLKVEEGLEGLVHISELDWALVEDPKKLFSVGDKVKAKIITIKDGKISLSIKTLKPSPWDGIKDKHKQGDIVKGIIIKFNKHGALASIEEGVAGLVHISEFESEGQMKEKLELGKAYDFQITVFEPNEQKLTLRYLDPNKKTA